MAPKGGNVLKNNAASFKYGNSRQLLLRKGPWTVAEDAMLIEYVKKHGEGNWNAVQRNSRLMRCGKSCRLRWANHLRPNLKKGAFSPEEERLIIELHAKFGNKWARMAAQLPGRTDNEIKNYWNTRLKRRLRAGLPIYPQQVNQPHHHQQQILQTNPSSSSVSPLLSSEPQSTNHNPSVSVLDMYNKPLSAITKDPLNQPENSCLSSPDHQIKLYRDDNGNLALSLSSSSSDSPCSSTSTTLPFLSQDRSPQPLTTSHSVFGSLSFGNNPPPFIGFSYKQSDLIVSSMGIELPSIQSPKVSSTNSGRDDYMIAQLGPKDDNHDNTVPNLSRGYSGLLQDLLAESQALALAEKSKESLPMEDKDKSHNAHQESTFGFGFDYAPPGKQSRDPTTGTKANKGTIEGINPVDDDLLSLLDNFPLAVPVANWYDEIGYGSGGEVSSFINGNVGTTTDHVEKEASPLASASSATRNNDSNVGFCHWSNMPDIYEL